MNDIRIIDTHCHLDFNELKTRLDEVIKDAKINNVTDMVTISTNLGSIDAIKLAVTGLKSQYEEATGKEGTMLTGKAPKPQRDAFRSQAELVAAMGDKRYDNDPAYRMDVMQKLERSNVNF